MLDFLYWVLALQASYSPYILEIFLWDMIIEEKSECVVSDNQFVLTLKKQNFGITWPSLTSEDLSKEDMRNIRQKALQDFEVIAKNQAVARSGELLKLYKYSFLTCCKWAQLNFISEKRDKLQKEAVKQQIQLDSSIINKIESIRDSHRREAMSDLEDWKNQHSKAFMIKEKGELQDNRKAYKWIHEFYIIVALKKSSNQIFCCTGHRCVGSKTIRKMKWRNNQCWKSHPIKQKVQKSFKKRIQMKFQVNRETIRPPVALTIPSQITKIRINWRNERDEKNSRTEGKAALSIKHWSVDVTCKLIL